MCSQYMILALTIAIRYCAVRKQFGPTENNELPVIEYQSQVCIVRIFFSSRKGNENYNLCETCTFSAMATSSSFSRDVCCKDILELFL